MEFSGLHLANTPWNFENRDKKNHDFVGHGFMV